MIIFSEQYIYSHWAKEETIKLRGKTWRVGKMSYGDYFLEPISWQGNESDGHSPQTIWLEKTIINNQLNYKI